MTSGPNATMGAGSGCRVALLSDTHGHLDARIEALARGCDFIVHAGDVGNAAVLQALQPLRRMIAVRGNNDIPAKWPAQDLKFLEQLGEEECLELPGGSLVVVHGDRAGSGAARHARLRRSYPAARAVVYGHSHQLVCDRTALPWVLNPGAAGRARTYGGPSCILLKALDLHWSVTVRRFPPAATGARPRGTRTACARGSGNGAAER